VSTSSTTSPEEKELYYRIKKC